MQQISRTLGTWEEVFWLLEQEKTLLASGTLRIEGQIAPELWEPALHRLQQRHPLLRMQVWKEAGQRPGFYPISAEDVPLRLVPLDEMQVDAEIVRALSEPFTAPDRPLYRVTVLHGEAESVLIFASHHVLFDGRTRILMLRELLQTLSGVAPSVTYDLLRSQDELFGLEAPGAYLETAAEPAMGVMTPVLDPAKRVPTVASITLEADRVTALRARAGREQTTMQGALVAAAVLAGRRHNEEWTTRPVTALIPFDSRPLLKLGEQPGLLFGGCVHVAPPQAGFWEIARQSTETLRSSRSFEVAAQGITWFRGSLASEVSVSQTAGLLRTLCSLDTLVSNLGVLDFGDEQMPWKVSGYWLHQAAAEYTTQSVGAATVRGRLCLAFGSLRPVDSFLTTLSSLLLEAAS